MMRCNFGVRSSVKRTEGRKIPVGANDVHVEGRPRSVACTKLSLVDSHIFRANSLGINAVKERDWSPSKDTRGEIPSLGCLLGRFRDNGDRGRVKGGPHPTVTSVLTILSCGGRCTWLSNVERKLETLALSGSRNMQELEAGAQALIERCPLRERSFTTFGYYGHG